MSMKLKGIAVFVALTLALVFCNASWGQVLKGSISGTVVDQQGGVVTGAQVKATHAETGAVYTTTSDSSGLFRFNLMPVGTYKVEIQAKGFKTTVAKNESVGAGVDTNLGSLKLTVGEVTDFLEVTAGAPLIETSTAQVTNTFGQVELNTFAGIQENQGLDNLALFTPGVSSVRDNSFSNTNGGLGFSVNGLRGRNNDQEIDGQNNNDNSVGGPGLFVTDAEFVQQYVLVTNNFGPEYGRNAGSVVNIITKSGTNAWHGNLFGTENNSILNSLNNFDKNKDICDPNCKTKPNRLNDEFGGFTIGGPMIKNKAFIFGGFDEEILGQNTTLTSSAFTPTPAGLAALAACFPASQSLQALLKFGPFAISGGNPKVVGTPVALVGTCPAATFAGVSRTVAQPFHGFDFILRNDWQVRGDTITARYIFNRGNSFNTDAFGTGAAGYVANVPALSQVMLLGWTHNLTAHMVNEARISFGRLNVEFGGNSIGNTVPNAGQIDQALANVTFNSSTLLGFGPATNAPQGRIVNTWQAQDNWNYVLGKHSLKAGVNFTYQRSPNTFLPNLNGQYRFGSWTSFLNNTPNRIRIANGNPTLDFREYDSFIFAGDDWKIGQHLTLNLGLTWTYYGQPANLFNDITTAREASATPFWASTEPLGTNNLGDTFTSPGAAIPVSARTNPLIPSPKKSFGPSIGFAYSPQWGGFLTGHGKTVIRGGYRLLYDPPFYNIYLNNSTAAPFSFLNTVPSPGTHPLPGVPTGPNVRASLASSIQKGVFDPREFSQTQITPTFGPDRTHTWSLGIEREIAKNAVIEARYVGNHAFGLFQTLDGNPFIADLKADFPSLVPAGLTPCPASSALFTRTGNSGSFGNDPVGRINCNFGVVRLRGNSGFSNYQGLQVEFRANNLFKQLTVRSAYTYSKTLDNVSEIFSTFGGGNTIFFAQNPANQVNGKGEYSFSGLDYPHQWSILFSEQLPFFKEQHGLLGHVLGGWGLSGNYIIASGQRYNPAQFGDAAFSAAGDYYDFGYILGFAGVDTARPFLGNLSAPATSVGAFCGDELSAATCTTAFGPSGVTQLISLTTLQGPTGALVATTKDKVRFIINAFESQTIFGTPFGNAPRNTVQDAPTNIGNFSVYKSVKLSERVTFQFHATFQNVFNHSNYASVDPFLDDAGLTGAFNGFGDPTQTPSVNNGAPPTRRIFFGGKVSF